MKYLFVFFFILIMAACGNKSGSGSNLFCDTTCMKDTIKFVKEDHSLKPYLYISAANCQADSVIWSYSGMGINRKLGFEDFGGYKFTLNKDYMHCFIKDTSYIWLLFNDCTNGRGYFAKIPFDKTKSINRRGSAINNIDPKYTVAEGLAAYTDRGNIFVEDMNTGKKAMMTFGEMLKDLDYDAMHEFIDSVHITPTRIWANVLIEKEWKKLEKNITLN